MKAVLDRIGENMYAEDLADLMAAEGCALEDVPAAHLAEVAGIARPPQEVRTAASILGALKRATHHASEANVRKLYEAVLTTPTIDYVFEFVALLVEDATLHRDRVRAVAKWFAEGAADPEPVRWALAMLGLVSQDEIELFSTLGRHHAFAFYAVKSASTSVRDPHRLVWELAKHLDGWDRTHAIGHLAGAEDEEIKGWLLRGGLDDPFMNNRTAHVRATSGGLLEALSRQHLDDALLEGAGEILRAMVCDEAVDDEEITNYADGVAAVEAYLGHVLQRPGTMQQFLVVHDIRRLCNDPEKDWTALTAAGWTPERRASIEQSARGFLARDHWRALAAAGLGASDPAEFDLAVEVARALGLDTWDQEFRHLLDGEDRWRGVMQTADPERADRVIALALERIPLAEVATGPADEDAVGPRFRHHSNLGWVVDGLERFPGKGLPLVHAALRSPVWSNRLYAVNALEAWRETHWGPETRALLETAAALEPDDWLRERMEEVLGGEGRTIRRA